MACFYTGDTLGNIKRIQCAKSTDDTWTFDESTVYGLEDPARVHSEDKNDHLSKTKKRAIQKMAFAKDGKHALLVAACADSTLKVIAPVSTSSCSNGELEASSILKETRMSSTDRFVGLNLNSSAAFWCTSNGVAGMTKLADEKFLPISQYTFLPTRLRAWHLSNDSKSFAYGGEEVDLSIWDTERAFECGQEKATAMPSGASKKRKRELFQGELWRAKNIPNDYLNLRHPVEITSLSFAGTGTLNSRQIVTGTSNGHVRRYDMRVARRPVANWTHFNVTGPIGQVRPGYSEHELFVTDSGSGLFAVDMRNGHKIYAYKQIQGTITDICLAAPNKLLGSTSQDRYFRLHSTAPPPEIAGRNQEDRGHVLNSHFMRSVPTAVVCDGSYIGTTRSDEGTVDGDDDDVWEALEKRTETRKRSRWNL